MRPRGVDVVYYMVYYNVSDLARAAAFYRDTLGLDVLFSRGLAGLTLFPVAELQAGATTLALIGTAAAPVGEADLASRWPEHRWYSTGPPPSSRRAAPSAAAPP
jgi:catechol 2,3-dioxygenase-like lactoylglutathione lyase family enzyme